MAGPTIPGTTQPVGFTAEIVKQYITFAQDFTADLSVALMPGIRILFVSLIGIWVIIEAIKILLGIKKIEDFPREFFFLIIASMLLSNQGDNLINYIYTAALNITGSVAGVVLNIGSNSNGPANINGLSGMADLVGAAEKAIMTIITLAGTIAASWGLSNNLALLYALILAIPYFIILLVYFSQVVISIFRVIMLATLSPFLMLAFGFGWGRGMAMKAIKTLIATIMVLFGSTAALAIILYGVTSLGIGQTGGMDVNDVSYTNAKFVLAVALGWLGTAFMAEATGIANSITEASLTNTGAAIITAAGAATGYAVAKNTVGKAWSNTGGRAYKAYIAPAPEKAVRAIGRAAINSFVDLDKKPFKNYKNAGLDKS